MRISPQISELVLTALKTSDDAEQQALVQLTTGRRVNVASDDPAAAALEVNLSSQMNNCDQFLRSISSISSELQTADSSLNSAVAPLQRAISLGVEGANGTLSQPDRATLAQEVRGISQQMLNVANLSYNGTYVFAGTANSQPPYVLDPTVPGGVRYQGNNGINEVEVEDGQTVAVNQPGSQLFSAAGANVFVALDDLATALENPGSTTGDIGDATNEVRVAYDQLNSARSFYGNTINQLTSSQDFLNSEKLQLSSQQNSTVGVDITTAAANLSSAEAARDATVQAAASLNNISLMDYLSPLQTP
ncbi:MAG TPA: flagellar hook-associated protein FlgL [Candidatus Binatia bacterium]|nr:flagellar hook-associated protein FlgL [Candidatus Binatia bacterium]